MRLIIDVNTKYCTERTSFVHILAKKQEVNVRHGNLQCGKLLLLVVLWIRIWSDPKLLAGSGHGFGKNPDPGSSGPERNFK